MNISSLKKHIYIRLKGFGFEGFTDTFSQDQKMYNIATRDMDFGSSISTSLEQMFSFLLLESNLIKVSTSRWLHLVQSSTRTPQRTEHKGAQSWRESFKSLETFRKKKG